MNASLTSIATPPASMAASDAHLSWLVPELQMFPLAARRCLVRNPLTGASLELSSGEHAVLSACEGCVSLAAHEALAAQRLSAPPEHRPAIRELLERCARHGLLMPLPELVKRFGAPHDGRAAPFAGLVVRTSDRPEQFLRLLRSLHALQARTGASYPLHVVDDSRRADARRANRAALRDGPSLDATYHDISGTDSLARELFAEYPDLAEEIHLLLDPARGDELTYGRPLNYIALRFAGSRLLVMDDDAVLDPRRSPSPRAKIEVGVSGEPAYWYETFDAAYAACPPHDCDPIEEHVRWLGLPLAQAWARAEDAGLGVGRLDGKSAARFTADARVLVTRSGLLGDPGWVAFSAQQLVLNDDTRAWLAARPDAVRYAFESQIQWRGHLGLNLVPRILPSSLLMGFDNSCLLPPTLRAGHGEDIIFGEAAACVHPNGWTLNFPFGLPHVRVRRREWLTPGGSLVADPARCLVMHMRAHAGDIVAEEPRERMIRLGGILRDLAETSDAALIAALEEQAAEYASGVRFAVHEQLDDPTTPGTWKNVLRQWLGSPTLRLDQESLHASIAPPSAVRAMAHDYGRTLAVWPQLWNHYRERSNGGPG